VQRATPERGGRASAKKDAKKEKAHAPSALRPSTIFIINMFLLSIFEKTPLFLQKKWRRWIFAILSRRFPDSQKAAIEHQSVLAQQRVPPMLPSRSSHSRTQAIVAATHLAAKGRRAPTMLAYSCLSGRVHMQHQSRLGRNSQEYTTRPDSARPRFPRRQVRRANNHHHLPQMTFEAYRASRPSSGHWRGSSKRERAYNFSLPRGAKRLRYNCTCSTRSN
jgi:hypothetical protein